MSLSKRQAQIAPTRGQSKLRTTLRKVSDNPQILSNKNVMICVSVGQSVHYGNHLKATFDLLDSINTALQSSKKPGIKSITVSANGTLQRHNFWYFACNPSATTQGNYIKPLSDQELETVLRDSPKNPTEAEFAAFLAEKFYSYALKAETDFIQYSNLMLSKDFPLFLRLHKNITFTTVSWDHWLSHPEYSAAYDALAAQYKANESFYYADDPKKTVHHAQDAFRETTDAIFHGGNTKKVAEAAKRITKFKPELATLDFTKVAEHASLQYLKEECPIIPGPLWADYHVVYPNEMTPAFKATAALTKTPINWHILNFKKFETESSNTICAIVDSDEPRPDASPQAELLEFKQPFPPDTNTVPSVVKRASPSSSTDEESKKNSEGKVSPIIPALLPPPSADKKQGGDRKDSKTSSHAPHARRTSDIVKSLNRTSSTPDLQQTDADSSVDEQELARLIEEKINIATHQFTRSLMEGIGKIPHGQKQAMVKLFKPKAQQAINAFITEMLSQRSNCHTPPPPSTKLSNKT